MEIVMSKNLLLTLTILTLSWTIPYSAVNQKIVGNGSIITNGNQNNIRSLSYHGNTITNLKGEKENEIPSQGQISDSKPDVEENASAIIKKDLEEGKLKDIYMEDKKDIRPTKKRVLLLTATNYETQLIHQSAELSGLTIQKALIHDHIVYHFGTLGGVEIMHMQPGMMDMMQPGSTPLVLMSVFKDIKPDYVIATGIAYGRKSLGQNLGDILISRQVVNYESRKETNDKIIFRGDKVTSTMLERVNGGIHSWKGCKIHQGLVLSGNALVNSQKFLEYLANREPEFVGGDMESFGVYAVASMMGAKWIMIKGISDWGDGTKNDNHHHIALENVGRFIFHVIKDGNLK